MLRLLLISFATSVGALRHHVLHLQLVNVSRGLCTAMIATPAAPAACQGAQRLVCTQESSKHHQCHTCSVPGSMETCAPLRAPTRH